MGLSYDDLIEPTIVRQVSKSVAYCRCTRTKNPPFCRSYAVQRIRAETIRHRIIEVGRILPAL